MLAPPARYEQNGNRASRLEIPAALVDDEGQIRDAGAAVLGAGVATYTAALISDTATPAWHDGYREMPFVFAGSAATAAGGFGLLAAPLPQQGPARALAVLGSAVELASFERMQRRIGIVAETYSDGTAGRLVKAGKILLATGVAGALLGRRSRVASAASGAALLAASACTRFGIFLAGTASAHDPKYTVVPQRQRLADRRPA